MKIDKKVVAIAIGVAVVITAVATGLLFTYGSGSPSAHASSAASCATDTLGTSPVGGTEVLQVCTFADGKTFHCLIVGSQTTALFCTAG